MSGLLTSPRNLKTEKGRSKRFYTWRGEQFWSVTTVLDNALPKRALTYWAAKKVAEAAADLAEQLPGLVAHDREAAVRMLKGAPWAESERAADVGTLIHAQVEARSLGQPIPEPPPVARPRLAAWRRFVVEHEPDYIATEAVVVNRACSYAGTLDAIVRLGGRPTLLDYKTGKGVYSETALQLAAYRFAEFIALVDGSEYPMPEVEAAVVLHLPADGTYELVEVQADGAAFGYFRYAQAIYRWLEQASKTALLGPLRSTAELGALAEASRPLAELLAEQARSGETSQTEEIPF